MFGLLVAGRLVQTDIQQVDTNRFLFQIHSASTAKRVSDFRFCFHVLVDDPRNTSHIVVFLTGEAPFPDGFAATVHFQWHDKPEWKLLGMLSNEKPSAIFKLKGALPVQVSGFGQAPSDTANIGILCEPVDAVQAQIASLPSSSAAMGTLVTTGSANTSNNLAIALKCAKNFLNYLSSFAQSAPSNSSLQAILHDPSAQSALMGLCERWYKGLESKTRNNVDWLNKEQD